MFIEEGDIIIDENEPLLGNYYVQFERMRDFGTLTLE